MNYKELKFNDSSISLDEILKKFDRFVIYESDSNNWKCQWFILDDFSLSEFINMTAKEIYDEMIENLHDGNFESENIRGVKIIDSKKLTILDEYEN